MAACEAASKKISGQMGGSGRTLSEFYEAKTRHLQVFRSALGRTRTCDLLIRRPKVAVLCGSLKCVWGLYKALPVLWGARLFYLVPVNFTDADPRPAGARARLRACPVQSPHSAIAHKPKEPVAQRESWYHHFHALPCSHELVGYNRDTTEL